MRVAYADPPYPGQARKHYADHPDFRGEVDHAALVDLLADFDGWILHTSSSALREILPLTPAGARVMGWGKTFSAFKKGVPVRYAWEPVVVVAARPPRYEQGARDWLEDRITTGRGLVGAKPADVCKWLFNVAGARPGDQLVDLYPGSSAVTRAWLEWCSPTLLEQRDHADAAIAAVAAEGTRVDEGDE